MLHPELAADPNIVDRFRTEALAGSRLSHPNVASVIDFGVTAEGTPFLVMEHVAGERLGRIIERDGVLSPRRACELVAQILSALEAAHAAGIIHADVKGDNVLVEVRRDGHEVVTLIDFGIARLTDRRTHADEETGRLLSGTPEYLAPEVIEGGAPTAASDLYSAGIVLYEMLVGETPFHGGSAPEIFRRHLVENPIEPSLRCPDADISPALDRVVMRAIAKDPAKRFAGAGDFAAALIAAMPAIDHRVDAPRMSGFSTEAPTQTWQVGTTRRRLAQGTRPRHMDRAERLRAAIGAAIVAGDAEAIASSYLDLARSLVAARRSDLATWELEQAIDVLTAGDGPETEAPPAPLWRVLLALASIYDGIGDTERALLIAQEARTAAIHVQSSTGRDRARVLLQRLAH
jgi:hypothetical protein